MTVRELMAELATKDPSMHVFVETEEGLHEPDTSILPVVIEYSGACASYPSAYVAVPAHAVEAPILRP